MTRQRQQVRSRWVEMYRLKHSGFSPFQIAKKMGMNHSTVYHGLRQYETFLQIYGSIY